MMIWKEFLVVHKKAGSDHYLAEPFKLDGFKVTEAMVERLKSESPGLKVYFRIKFASIAE